MVAYFFVLTLLIRMENTTIMLADVFKIIEENTLLWINSLKSNHM